MDLKEFKNRVYSTFANVSSSIGYSEVHGRIIAALIANNEMLTLEELSRETGYSRASISLSLDFLEVIGMIAKVKKTGDRKLYIKLDGDLLEVLKRAIVIRTEKNIKSALSEFENYKDAYNQLDAEERQKIKGIIKRLTDELNRLYRYIGLLSEVDMDEDLSKLREARTP